MPLLSPACPLIDAPVVTSEQGLFPEDGDVAEAIEVVGDRRTDRLVHTHPRVGVAGDDHAVGIGIASGLSNTPRTTEKSATFAPMHTASVSPAVTVKALSLHSSRTPTRRSASKRIHSRYLTGARTTTFLAHRHKVEPHARRSEAKPR